MNNLIKQAIKLIENISYTPQYSSIYMFATENLKGVMKSIDVAGKKVLTVSSSGDHIFNMLLHGAKSIEGYDINYFTEYFFYFKEAAIRSLNYKEFLDFFFKKRYSFNSKVFSNEVFFNKIVPNFKNEEAKQFWIALFKGYGGKVLYNSLLFYKNDYSKNTYIECNDYLKNETNYKIVQEKLIDYNYKFYPLNIFEDISCLKANKYDTIYLSNILDRLYCKNELLLVKKIKEIITTLKKHLTESGILALCYLYLYRDDYWENLSPKQITSYWFRLKYFSSEECFYNSFNGINAPNVPNNKDALMLIKK